MQKWDEDLPAHYRTSNVSDKLMLKLIEEQKQTNELLKQMVEIMKKWE
jgi:hypothetical protein